MRMRSRWRLCINLASNGMRIGIDARFFGPRQTGLGRYVERLVTHLQRIDQRNDYVLFLRQEGYDAWQPSNPRWTKVLADYRWYTVAEQRHMPAIFNRQRLDLLHVPHFNVPVLYRGRFVTTIHDLILDQFPTERVSTLEPLKFWAKFAAYKYVVRHAIHQSAHVITISEHSRQEIIRRFRIKPDKVSVTYESVDPLAAPVPLTDLQARGVRRPFLLHVGNSYPHKNLERLVLAWHALQSHQPGGQLVLVGHRDYFSRRLEQLARDRGIDNILWYGFATEAELSSLYRSAVGYIFPSLSEGFGLPGLEAMSVGTPVFAARTSCLPEIFGSAAEYFNPHDTADMTRILEHALHDQPMQAVLRQLGQQCLQKYSWARLAEQTLAVYERAVKASA